MANRFAEVFPGLRPWRELAALDPTINALVGADASDDEAADVLAHRLRELEKTCTRLHEITVTPLRMPQ